MKGTAEWWQPQGAMTGSRSSRRCCSRSRRSPPPGAAIRRRVGVASRRKSRSAPCEPPRERSSRARRRQRPKSADPDRCRPSSRAVGRRLRAPRRTKLSGLLLQAVPRGVQARPRGVARDEAAQESERPPDAVRDARVQVEPSRRTPIASSSHCEGSTTDREGRQPALGQLRSLRRPLRDVAFLCGHLDQARLDQESVPPSLS